MLKLKGSYTVEGAMVISFCFILFGMAVCLAYELFKIALDYVSNYNSQFDAVKVFRLKEGVMGVIHALKG